MFSNNVFLMLSMISICLIIRQTYSFANDEQGTVSAILDEPLLIDSDSSLNDQYATKHQTIDLERPSFSNRRRSESAERYFGWAGKTQRPVEFLRGKRFWLFAKKDEYGAGPEVVPSSYAHHGSLTQGLWRSGIVGRRRRR